MGWIYRLAYFTLAWIGSDDGYASNDEDGEQALSLFYEIRTSLDPFPTQQAQLHPGPFLIQPLPALPPSKYDFKISLVDHIEHPELVAASDIIQKFLMREYWSRMWIIQEYVLSKQIYIMCGKRIIPGTYMDTLIRTDFITKMTNWQYKIPESPVKTNVHDLSSHMNHPRTQKCTTVLRLREDWEFVSKQDAAQLSLCDILFEIHRRGPGHDIPIVTHVTDPRDAIFGALGLASDEKELGIIPDYSITCARLFVQTSRAFIFKQQKLWIITHSQYENRRRDIPSWCPDWSQPFPPRNILLESWESDGMSLKYQSQIFGYEALAPTTPGIKLDYEADRTFDLRGMAPGIADDTVLVVRGIIVDKITIITFLNDWDSYWPWMKNIIELILGHEFSLDDCSRQVLSRAVKIAVMEGMPWLPKHAAAAKMFCPEKCLNEEYAIEVCLNLLKHGFSHHSNVIAFRAPHDEYYFVAACLYQNKERRSFATTMGRIGLGLPCTEEGDTVAIIFGVRVPLILRQSATDRARWKVVGPAYVEDMMFGEAMDLQLPEQLFYLE